MGLDNGIILRKKTTNKSLVEELQNSLLEKVNITSDDGFYKKEAGSEVCYWRKCWNIRKEILNILDTPSNTELSNSGYYQIEADDILPIVNRILKIYDRDNWNESNDSIWDFDEIKESLAMDVINLIKLQEYLNKHKDVVALFYDSY